eukprot:13300997-Heterocapsa_arctica.AAC.1
MLQDAGNGHLLPLLQNHVNASYMCVDNDWWKSHQGFPQGSSYAPKLFRGGIDSAMLQWRQTRSLSRHEV